MSVSNKLNLIFKRGVQGILIFFALLVLLVNVGLLYTPKFVKPEEEIYPKNLLHQLQFLQQAKDKEADIKMQSIYPEGYVFFNALYALSWINFLQGLKPTSELYQQGIAQVDDAIADLLSEEAKANFNQDLAISYGVFYRGWSNYVIGERLLLTGVGSEEALVEKTRAYTIAIILGVNNSEAPFLESYKEAAWPADMVVAMASVDIYNELFNNEYREEVDSFMEILKQNLDPETGLIPHAYDFRNNRILEGSRGSSQSLMLNFLFDLDVDFAQQQFIVYDSLFYTSRLSLPAIREHPRGKKSYADIDSGPVIWGIGGAASIVGQRTYGLFGRAETYAGLRNAIQAFGLACSFGQKKRYLFGSLPMADAFIAWSNSIEIRPEMKIKTVFYWRFHLGSLFLLFSLLWMAKKI